MQGAASPPSWTCRYALKKGVHELFACVCICVCACVGVGVGVGVGGWVYVRVEFLLAVLRQCVMYKAGPV
jgi:hypothetical protein